MNFSQPDAAALRDVAKCIATAPDVGRARPLQKLVEWTQVQRARLDRFEDRRSQSVSALEVAERLVDAGTLGALLDDLFAYARFEAPRVSADPPVEMVESALFIEGVRRDDPSFDDVFRLLDKKKPAPP